MGEQGELEGCLKCMKYLLLVLNFVFWVCGVAMVGIGIWILVDYSSFTKVLDNPLINSAVYLLIGIGGVITIIAFLGCCGAMKESKILLALYGLILLVMFIAEIAVAGMIFYFGYSDVEERFLKAANETFVKYGTEQAIAESWDSIQHLGECCGIKSPDDYQYTQWSETGKTFPDSCCAVKDLKSGVYKDQTKCHAKVDGFFYKTGCLNKLKAFVQDNVVIAAGVAIGVAVLQLIGIIGGCMLCKAK
ncbi:tetraspanin-18-like [Glandiceps talaboti]